LTENVRRYSDFHDTITGILRRAFSSVDYEATRLTMTDSCNHSRALVFFHPTAHRVTVCCIAWICSLAACQTLRGAPEVEAYYGEPFGVGRVTLDVFRDEPSLPLHDERFTVTEPNGRVMMPLLKQEPVRQFLRNLLEIDTPRRVTLFFLFRGDEPFDLSGYSPVEQGVRVVPRHNPSAHQSLFNQWWKETTDQWQRLQRDPQFPPYAQNFIVATYARRLGRSIPEPRTGFLGLNRNRDTSWMESFRGEAAVLEIDREMLTAGDDPDAELFDVPAVPVWPDLMEELVEHQDVAIEPLATHVPVECFYLRFGNFHNYFWVRDLNEKWQGDLQNMILRRGIDRLAAERLQQQLSLKENALSRILGPQFISDAALIGLDTNLAQGAAIGIVVHARNSDLLRQDFMRQRRTALEVFDDAEESTVELAGSDVSLIATPDGQVRSYYAQSGDFHLVSTSETLARRFLETGQGEESLADLPSFHNARHKLPLAREDTIFAFVSERFFENLCSPQQWIESRRRLRSSREPHLLQLARYVAAMEGFAAESREELIAAGILPEGFAVRADGSEHLETDAGPLDSLRGMPGYFVPAADVALEAVTAQEAAAYREFLEELQEQVGRIPPLAVGVQRVPRTDGDLQTVVIDVVSSPLGEFKPASVFDSLGETSYKKMGTVEGDVASFEIALDMQTPILGGDGRAHRIFGGLRDFRSPLTVQSGVLAPRTQVTELVRGYLGAWPRPGLLGVFAGASIPQQPSPQPIGPNLWQGGHEDMVLLSFKPAVIEEVLPQLRIVEAERPAQVRVQMDDLAGKQLEATANALGYMRARETSVAASRTMNSLSNLLQVPPQESRQVAENLVDGVFVCPLGGSYELLAPERGVEVWCSTALPAHNRFLLRAVPEDFRMDLLEWFRGLSAEVEADDRQLRVRLEIDISASALP